MKCWREQSARRRDWNPNAWTRAGSSHHLHNPWGRPTCGSRLVALGRKNYLFAAPTPAPSARRWRTQCWRPARCTSSTRGRTSTTCSRRLPATGRSGRSTGACPTAGRRSTPRRFATHVRPELGVSRAHRSPIQIHGTPAPLGSQRCGRAAFRAFRRRRRAATSATICAPISHATWIPGSSAQLESLGLLLLWPSGLGASCAGLHSLGLGVPLPCVSNQPTMMEPRLNNLREDHVCKKRQGEERPVEFRQAG